MANPTASLHLKTNRNQQSRKRIPITTTGRKWPSNTNALQQKPISPYIPNTRHQIQKQCFSSTPLAEPRKIGWEQPRSTLSRGRPSNVAENKYNKNQSI